MSTTTKSGGIFTFDHGQKSLNKAIGIEQSYLEELGDKVADSLKGFIFDDDDNPREEMSPSGLVELCATEFSYSQLVILSSFYLQDKLDGFAKKLEKKVKGMKSGVRSISLDADDLPDNIKEILDGLTGGDSRANAIDGDSLPPELKAFLKRLSQEQDDDED
jgi:hypothetical protein